MKKNRLFNITSLMLLVLLFFFCEPSKTGHNQSKSSGNKDESTSSSIIQKLPEQPAIDYYTPDYLRYGDYVNKDNIRTVLLNKKGWEFSPPMIKLESGEKLVLSFDDLDADHKSYYYTIIHCDAKWRLSDLRPDQYIAGFYDDRIYEFSHSFNTQVRYTNYRLEFPNENMRPKIPGNYILKVFLDNDRENLVLTRKFMVYEQKVTVSGSVRLATRVSLRDFKQELNFSINTHQYRIDDPYRDVTVIIKQNGRWDNVIHELQPRTVSNNILRYHYESEILFDGGNEFRYFDTKSLKHSTAMIDDIVYQPAYREVFLRKDFSRRNKRYIFEHDINGRFYIQNEYGYNPHLESDYAMVHFNLSMAAPLAHGNVYLAGELTDWNYTESNRMEYNYEEKAYQISLLLKQGYYNYVYMFLEDGHDRADITMIEGNHSDTENGYTILVYHRRPGTFFDRLIGMKHLNTHDDD